jgi:hypothetical protein
MSGFGFLLFVASCRSNQFAVSGKRYAVGRIDFLDCQISASGGKVDSSGTSEGRVVQPESLRGTKSESLIPPAEVIKKPRAEDATRLQSREENEFHGLRIGILSQGRNP